MEDSLYMKSRTFVRGKVLDILGLIHTPQKGIHILNGHRTQGEKEPETFYMQLKELSKYVKFINIEEAIDMIGKKV